MKLWRLLILCALPLALAVGCGDDDDSATDGGTDTDTDTDTDGDTDTDSDSDSDTDTDADTNNSCAEALPMGVDATPIQDDLTNHDDEDFYLIDLTEGDFVQIWTDIHADDTTEGLLDPVITLWNEAGDTLLATADDQIPRVDMDSELQYRAPSTGTYCVKIESWDNWAGTAGAAVSDFNYAMGALLMDPSVEGWVDGVMNPETETNDTVGDADALTFASASTGSNTFAVVYGTMGSGSDMDYFSYTMPAGTVSASFDIFKPFGAGDGATQLQGNGSTLTNAKIEVTDPTGTTVYSSLDISLDYEDWNSQTSPWPDIHIPIAAGEEVAVWIEGGTGWTAGSNDFYVMDVFNYDSDNQAETEDPSTTANTNDSTTNAESITMAANTSGGESGYIMGTVDPVSGTVDVDYWEFSALAGEEIVLACGAASSGSGLTGASFAIHNASDTEVQEETESGYDQIWWSNNTGASSPAITVSANATYYLVVTATGQSTDMTANHYRCGVHRTVP